MNSFALFNIIKGTVSNATVHVADALSNGVNITATTIVSTADAATTSLASTAEAATTSLQQSVQFTIPPYIIKAGLTFAAVMSVVCFFALWDRKERVMLLLSISAALYIIYQMMNVVAPIVTFVSVNMSYCFLLLSLLEAIRTRNYFSLLLLTLPIYNMWTALGGLATAVSAVSTTPVFVLGAGVVVSACLVLGSLWKQKSDRKRGLFSNSQATMVSDETITDWSALYNSAPPNVKLTSPDLNIAATIDYSRLDESSDTKITFPLNINSLKLSVKPEQMNETPIFPETDRKKKNITFIFTTLPKRSSHANLNLYSAIAGAFAFSHVELHYCCDEQSIDEFYIPNNRMLGSVTHYISFKQHIVKMPIQLGLRSENQLSVYYKKLEDSACERKQTSAAHLTHLTSRSSRRALGEFTLRNPANRCYMNSVMQCLAQTSELKACLTGNVNDELFRLSDEFFSAIDNPDVPLSRIQDTFESLLKEMSRTPVQDSKSGRTVANFSGQTQEDAAEYLDVYLGRLQTIHMNLVAPGTAMVSVETQFGIHYDSVLSSLTSCGAPVTRKREKLFILQLALPPALNVITLRNCIDNWSRSESVPMTCTGCGLRHDFKKNLSLVAGSAILIIQLKRTTAQMTKDTRRVSFETTYESKVLLPASDQKVSQYYDLYAVISHIGTTAHGGHYVAYIKRRDGRWSLRNDSTSCDVTEARVKNVTADLLFYRRKMN